MCHSCLLGLFDASEVIVSRKDRLTVHPFGNHFEFVLRLAVLEFLGDVHAEGAALEPIFSKVLVKAMNIDRQDPRDVGQAELASHSVDLIERSGRRAAAIVGDLPRIVASWPDFS